MVNTFLPYKDFEESAKVLDIKRLFKQIVECKQILNILLEKTEKKGYKNHPAVKMWESYEKALRYYQFCMLKEWIKRRWEFNISEEGIEKPSETELPTWLGDENFHAAHRSNLLRKDKEYYGSFGWQEPDNLDYVWPTKS